MYETLDSAVSGIIAELAQPQNRDLMLAVVAHGRDDDGSFMATFNHARELGFDEYAALSHQFDAIIPLIEEATGQAAIPDYRSMSQRYDDYLADLNTNKRLNETQTSRMEAITTKFDDGWSGAVYGMVMRHVQFTLIRILNN